MPRLLPAFARKALTASAVAILLVCIPSQLAAVEKEAPSADQVSMLAWFSSVWSDLAAWFAGDEVPPPPPPETPSQSDTDNGHVLDPHGG